MKQIKIFSGIGLLIFLLGAFIFWHKIFLWFYAREQVLSGKYVYVNSYANHQNVAYMLQREGVITDAEHFIDLSELKHYTAKHVVAGKYKIEPFFTHNDVINTLRAGRGVLPVAVTFNNVRNFEELAGKVSKQIEADSLSLIRALRDPHQQKKYGLSQSTFMAMFVPDTYSFSWNTSAEEFIARMNKEYKKFWSDYRLERAKKIGLNPIQVTTLASIVKAEQEVHADEQPIIAGLYINRLHKRMKLQSDPTVKYAVGNFGLRRILNEHLQHSHPYNTYRNYGLPPGPINVPEKHIIDAVLNPKTHNYIYMCASPGYSGKHLFASSFIDHQKNARSYQQWLNQQKIIR
jgi:UPF0755 protein